MKKHIFLSVIVIVMSILFAIGATTTSAIPVDITYTADNVIHSWWQVLDGSTPEELLLGGGADWWPNTDSFTLELQQDSWYQIIWQVQNSGTPSFGNPGGFLAGMSQNPQLLYADYLSSSYWEVAVQYGSLSMPNDFSTLNWVSATEYGANNDSSTIWYQALGVSVPGISGDAQWIWTAANFGDSGAPGEGDSVFIRTRIETDNPSVAVPEPSTLLLLGSGLLGISFAYRKKFRRQSKIQ